MSEPKSSTTGMRCLPAVFYFLALFGTGCAASREIRSSDETFFQPVKSIEQKEPIEAKSVPDDRKPIGEEKKVSGGKKSAVSVRSSAISRADSLVRSQAEQERRMDALAAQLRALESGRKEERKAPDSALARDRSNVVSTPRPERPAPAPSTTFAQAVQLYDARNYQGALGAFEDLMRGRLSAAGRSECAYYAGMSNFRLGRYDGAVTWLKLVAADIPGKKVEALFTMGLSYKHLGMSDRAKELFESVVKESPGSDFAADAREELKGLARK